ncbi:MFS transporter [Streptomyces olivochromogenes]|uniref:MFS transporter n=1 Tax=Streptomyces olivochromogenes TaxID=1963 RepID=UPI001F1A8D18|nr:MFS transporter [Streptomyces olivochromogenes]MCF3131259.1 MFS transporter [Streptomyces olivochromogenes]
MTTTIDETAGTARGLRGQAVRLLPSLLVLAVLLSQIDSTGAPLGAHGGRLPRPPWEAVAYPLATAAALPALGRLGDRRGRRCVLVGALMVFLAGASLSAAARAPDTLVAFRTLQGIGAGGVTAAVVAFLAERVPAQERASYQGVLVGATTLAMTGGPVADGTITEHLGRHWAVTVLLPLGVLALLLAAALPPAPRPDGAPRADYRGAALLLVALTVLVRIATWGGAGHAPRTDDLLALALDGADRLFSLFS